MSFFKIRTCSPLQFRISSATRGRLPRSARLASVAEAASRGDARAPYCSNSHTRWKHSSSDNITVGGNIAPAHGRLSMPIVRAADPPPKLGKALTLAGKYKPAGLMELLSLFRPKRKFTSTGGGGTASTKDGGQYPKSAASSAASSAMAERTTTSRAVTLPRPVSFGSAPSCSNSARMSVEARDSRAAIRGGCWDSRRGLHMASGSSSIAAATAVLSPARIAVSSGSEKRACFGTALDDASSRKKFG
mmetsp:Transcript_115008/g.330371  ORF Transcript_115008/g.330371 Transcript_115008/m.330371 type:complete len:247 (+) Transcript_115008:411-1151(+)